MQFRAFFFKISALALTISTVTVPVLSGSTFDVRVDKQGRYEVVVDNESWLRSAPTYLTSDHKHYSVKDGSLKLMNKDTETGWDALGRWNMTAFYYRPSGSNVKVKFMVKWYAELPVVLFGQQFLTVVNGSSVGDRFRVSSGFPSFYMEDSHVTGRSSNLGYLAYGGIMTGDTAKSSGIWNNKSHPTTGLDSGPLVLFDKTGQAIIISPFDNLMAASAQYGPRDGAMAVTWGLLGSVDHIPVGFSYWTAIMYSKDGVNKLLDQWGAVMRWYYKKDRSYTSSDLTNNYIGYWTDNGAYYYYLTEGSLNYQDTILAVKQYSDAKNIPYRYVQYDSWFYPKGGANGVTEWDSMLKIFPNGLKYMWEKTGWPVVAHNRWWSNATVYAKQNGGKYDFFLENKTKKAIPLDQRFWDDLMVQSKKWGLIVYEQDWLNVQFDEMFVTVESLTLGRQWLHQMANGASKSGITIQYCMAPSRHVLTSLELPVVSQARVSNDYQPGQQNWKIGISSMFAHALGLAPFKDNFWTTKVQPGNVYNRTEPHPELHSLAATLSTGPVGPSDKVGYSDVNLIMKSCNRDGLILKPSKPAMAVDKQLIMTAYSGFRGELWSTYSYISGIHFGIVLGADFSKNDIVSVTPQDAGFNPTRPLRQFTWNTAPHLSSFSQEDPISLMGCVYFCLVYSSPVLKLENLDIVILGELEKWVPMSSKRVTSITIATNDIQLYLTGAVTETVTMTISKNGVITTLPCTLGDSGTAVLSLTSSECRPT